MFDASKEMDSLSDILRARPTRVRTLHWKLDSALQWADRNTQNKRSAALPYFIFGSCPGPPVILNFGMRSSIRGKAGKGAWGSAWYQ